MHDYFLQEIKYTKEKVSMGGTAIFDSVTAELKPRCLKNLEKHASNVMRRRVSGISNHSTKSNKKENK